MTGPQKIITHRDVQKIPKMVPVGGMCMGRGKFLME